LYPKRLQKIKLLTSDFRLPTDYLRISTVFFDSIYI